ncbi:MAG: endonuclease [Candidatus Saccharibacteria bacterium]|nr:endonuclease [Candidatus Saccharibacteria bacterium]
MVRKKLNSAGVAHIFVLAIVVVSVAIGGAYYVIASHADTATKPKGNPNTIRVASYNVLGAGYPQAPPHDNKFGVNTLVRAHLAADTMISSNVDIVGVQELDTVDNQFGKVKDRMTGNGYRALPTNAKASGRAGQRAIFWKTDRFTAVKTGTIAFPYQDAPYNKKTKKFQLNDKLNWVLLKDTKTEDQLYVVSAHLVARNNKECRYKCNPPGTPGGTDAGGAQKRKAAADILADWVKQRKATHPVILVGDFNSPFSLKSTEKGVISRDEIPYCRLTRAVNGAAIIRNAWDTYTGRSGHCPYNTDKPIIDHVYATQRFAVTRWVRPYNLVTNKASDHRPLIVDLLLSKNSKSNLTSENGGDADYQDDSFNLGDASNQALLDQNVYSDDNIDNYTD